MTQLIEKELLRAGFRTSADWDDYPNTITIESILREVEQRIGRGYTPLEAFLTVTDGVKRWSENEKDVARLSL